MYHTVEAILDKDKVVFQNGYNIVDKKVKVLITFIEVNDDNLYEIDEKDISKNMLEGKIKVLKKDKSLFTNI